MSGVNLSTVLNIKEWPKALSSIKNLDWRVRVVAAIGIASLVVIFIVMKDQQKIIKRPTQDATADQLFTNRQLRDPDLKAAAVAIVTRVLTASLQSPLNNRIVLRKDQSPIAYYLNVGLPRDVYYATVQDEYTKQKSYARRVLQALNSKGFIEKFEESDTTFVITINPPKA